MIACENLQPAESRDNLFRNPGVLTALLYTLVSVVPHTIALRYTLALIMLLVLIYQVFRGDLISPIRNVVTRWVFALCAIASLSAFLSPYFQESIHILRKETLLFVLPYILLTCQKLNSNQIRLLIRYCVIAILLGYSSRLGLAIYDGISNNWQFSVYNGMDVVPKYLDYFASDIVYYLPFLLGALFYWPGSKATRIALGLVVILTLMFALFSGVRTTFVFMILSVFAFIFIRFWSKKIIICTTIGLALLMSSLIGREVSNTSIKRYSSIFSIETYSKFGADGSVSERKAITKAVLEISSERPLFGFGPGWKKLPTVAEDLGYMERWKKSDDIVDQWAFKYFSYGRGRVNPHNFYTTVFFEVGLLGLASYLGLFFAIAWSAVKLFKRNAELQFIRGVGLTNLIYVATYLGSGFLSGPWLPVSFLACAVISALGEHLNS